MKRRLDDRHAYPVLLAWFLVFLFFLGIDRGPGGIAYEKTFGYFHIAMGPTEQVDPGDENGDDPPDDTGTAVHPILYFTESEIPSLQAKWNDPAYAIVVDKIMTRANALLVNTTDPVSNADFPFDDTVRSYDDDMMNLAFVYLMTGDTTYKDRAMEFLNAMIGYPDWLNSVNSDLTRANFARGLATVYDWLYNELDASTRLAIENKLIYEMGQSGVGEYLRWQNNWVWYTTRPWQNHSRESLSALGIAGHALDQSYGEAKSWHQYAKAKLAIWDSITPPDGSWHESIPYMMTGMHPSGDYYMVRKKVAGIAVPSNPYYQNNSKFFAYNTYPDNLTIYPFADAWGNLYSHLSQSAHYMSFLSQDYNDTLAQTVLNNYLPYILPWNNTPILFLSYDPSAPSTPLSSLPEYHLFDDLGIADFRSDWTSSASMLTMISGWYGGVAANQNHGGGTLMNNGHEHPDRNSFTYWDDGTLWLKDYWSKIHVLDTFGHNTVTFDGYGQRPVRSLENTTGLTLFNQYINSNDPLSVQVTSDYKFATADAAKIYEINAGVNKFRRNFFFRDDYMLIFDDIDLNADRSIDWYFHSDHDWSAKADGFLLTADDGRTLDMNIAAPTSYSHSFTAEPNNSESITISSSGDNAQFLALLSTDPSIKIVDYSVVGDIHTIEVNDGSGDNQILVFDISNETFDFSYASAQSGDDGGDTGGDTGGDDGDGLGGTGEENSTSSDEGIEEPQDQGSSHPDRGRLIALTGQQGAAVYQIGVDGRKYVFPDSKTYFTWYDDFDDVERVSVSVLDSYPDGGSIPYRAGTRLITHVDTAKVYAVATNGRVHWIPDEQTAVALYGNNWANRVQDVIPGFFAVSYTVAEDLDTLNSYPDGSLLQKGQNIYYIDSGVKRLFSSIEAFFENGFNTNDVVVVDVVSNYTTGQPISGYEEDLSIY